jgi:hypothetical protein
MKFSKDIMQLGSTLNRTFQFLTVLNINMADKRTSDMGAILICSACLLLRCRVDNKRE